MSLLHTALAEAAGGATAGVIADSVLYAIDSAKVRQQSELIQSSNGKSAGIRILFRGMVPTILLGSVPVFGTFFLLYAPLREMLHHSKYDSLLPLASAVCAIPATLVGIPSDVIKKRLVLGVDPNVMTAIHHITADRGWKGLFAGFQVNLIRDIPFAAVKVGLYEMFASQYKAWNGQSNKDPISPEGAAMCGVLSGVACAVLTCPLDCINTRIKDGSTTCTSIVKVGQQIVTKQGLSGLYRGVVMRSIVLGIGSSIFWPIQRSTAHWLQPNYEEDPNFHDRLEDF
jgi:solute carrier family 25 (mitochondrial iron transporter), member 28/37